MPDTSTSSTLLPEQQCASGLLLCAGKDCFKKERKAFKALRGAAERAGLDVDLIRCQGSCAGPTAVVINQGDPRWFEKLQSPTAQSDLIELATGASEHPSKKLAKRELTGKQRRKAAKKLSKLSVGANA